MGRRESNDYLADTVGTRNDDGLYEAMLFERYVARKRPSALSSVEGDRVAVIEVYPPTVATNMGDTLSSKKITAEECVQALTRQLARGRWRQIPQTPPWLYRT